MGFNEFGAAERMTEGIWLGLRIAAGEDDDGMREGTPEGGQEDCMEVRVIDGEEDGCMLEGTPEGG